MPCIYPPWLLFPLVFASSNVVVSVGRFDASRGSNVQLNHVDLVVAPDALLLGGILSALKGRSMTGKGLKARFGDERAIHGPIPLLRPFMAETF